MNKFPQLSLSFAVVLSLVITPSAQAKVKVSKPVAPTVAQVSSSSASKGKVTITITLELPTNSSGAKISGSKVTAGGKSCLITKAKTSCTIKGIKNGAILKVRSQSKNLKGYGVRSTAIRYVAGSPTYRAPVISSLPQIPVVSPVTATPTPTPSEEVIVPADPTLISTAAIAGLSVPLPGNVPDTSVTPGTGYTASVSWSPNHAAFVSNTSYTATITLTAATDYTLTGVAANFFTVVGSSSDTNPVNSGVVTAVFPGVVYAINEVGPAGGLIFITPTTVGNTTGKYFEAAAADLSSTKTWCNVTTSVGTTGSAIGDGLANTNLIAAACTSGAGQDAVDYAITLDSVTYADWFLPSQDELNELCLAAKVTRPSDTTCVPGSLKSGFASGSYWSSTEFTDTAVYSQNLSAGELEASEKNFPANVRVVRSFS
jgi:hypothetical protein